MSLREKIDLKLARIRQIKQEIIDLGLEKAVLEREVKELSVSLKYRGFIAVVDITSGLVIKTGN